MSDNKLRPRNISREWEEIHAERDALRAEIERLKAAVTDLGALHTQDYVENERLRAVVDAAEALRESAATINQPPWLPWPALDLALESALARDKRA